jgi:hypothetical protein
MKRIPKIPLVSATQDLRVAETGFLDQHFLNVQCVLLVMFAFSERILHHVPLDRTPWEVLLNVPSVLLVNLVMLKLEQACSRHVKLVQMDIFNRRKDKRVVTRVRTTNIKGMITPTVLVFSLGITGAMSTTAPFRMLMRMVVQIRHITHNVSAQRVSTVKDHPWNQCSVRKDSSHHHLGPNPVLRVLKDTHHRKITLTVSKIMNVS